MSISSSIKEPNGKRYIRILHFVLHQLLSSL